ncbi:hypothetical protein AJ80_05729 [Polytolypa hystricis UAMH7299]|uniref:VOC domain-containing protein n=1 Tax=Polytolypa hystricis (strain UAMH7299) TaxID=1447883 RepID=A0A2B7Y0H2_POLH7|nr:hypothetical protein AJ80_05729 [Polytolypa hystricis UAMH7299]
MAETWTPPAAGTPVWIQIPATDVQRAKSFYSTTFSWSFKPSAAGGPEKMATFTFPDKGYTSLSGGITQVSPENHTKGGETVVVYFYVDDLGSCMDTIVKNGGKKCSDIEPEGEIGSYMIAEDTEGNRLGIWSLNKPASSA